MRWLFTTAMAVLSVQTAQASSIVTLPPSQSTPSVIMLGEPAVEAASTASIKSRPVRYEAPVIISGNGSSTLTVEQAPATAAGAAPQSGSAAAQSASGGNVEPRSEQMAEEAPTPPPVQPPSSNIRPL
jgi:hypothetical protein